MISLSSKVIKLVRMLQGEALKRIRGAVYRKKFDQRELIKVAQRQFRKYMQMRDWGWFVIIQKVATEHDMIINPFTIIIMIILIIVIFTRPVASSACPTLPRSLHSWRPRLVCELRTFYFISQSSKIFMFQYFQSLGSC